MKIIGWIASIAFMFSGLPAAIESIQTETCTVPTGTLILWTIGELAALIYMLPKKDSPLITNYIVNLIFLGIIWFNF